MKFSLATRILGWLFLNLILLALGLLAFLRFQTHFGLDAFFSGPSKNRVSAVARLISDEMRSAPRENWNAILRRFDSAYGIHFALYSPVWDQVAGDALKVPPGVREKAPLPPRRPRMRGPNPGREMQEPGPPPAPGEMRRPPNPPMDGPDMGEPGIPNGEVPMNLVRAGDPQRYWILTLMAPHPSFRAGPPFLVIVSETLSAGGLIFDNRPWIIASCGVLVLCILFWLPLVRGMSSAISRMTRSTTEIAGGNFSIRAPGERSDELGELGRSINQMAERLACFIQGQKRFLGDTAHELVSPLARMELGLSILGQRLPEQERASLRDVHEEVRLMSSLVNELLSFSKASVGDVNIQLSPIPLLELVSKTIQREAAEKVEVKVDAAHVILGNRELLQRAFGNVIRNALQHAGNSGAIAVESSQSGKNISVIFADNGPGIREQFLPQIFDPFFRPDTSRDRATGGTGLGLAIVKTCVAACGGTVVCRNKKPSGLEVIFTLRSASGDS